MTRLPCLGCGKVTVINGGTTGRYFRWEIRQVIDKFLITKIIKYKLYYDADVARRGNVTRKVEEYFSTITGKMKE